MNFSNAKFISDNVNDYSMISSRFRVSELQARLISKYYQRVVDRT